LYHSCTTFLRLLREIKGKVKLILSINTNNKLLKEEKGIGEIGFWPR